MRAQNAYLPTLPRFSEALASWKLWGWILASWGFLGEVLASWNLWGWVLVSWASWAGSGFLVPPFLGEALASWNLWGWILAPQRCPVTSGLPLRLARAKEAANRGSLASGADQHYEGNLFV